MKVLHPILNKQQVTVSANELDIVLGQAREGEALGGVLYKLDVLADDFTQEEISFLSDEKGFPHEHPSAEKLLNFAKAATKLLFNEDRGLS